ncbi:MAG: hypothetical protein ACI4U4_03920 [Bacilli bacterium]
MLKINRNKIELIGKITSLSYERKDINGKRFMFFDIVQNDKLDNNSYSSSFYKVKLNEELLNKYQDIIKVSNNIYIIGYLNSYLKDNQNIYYIYPKEIKLLDKNYKLEDDDIPMIDYDTDGVMLWHGKRCEAIPPSEEELKEMEDLLSEFK